MYYKEHWHVHNSWLSPASLWRNRSASELCVVLFCGDGWIKAWGWVSKPEGLRVNEKASLFCPHSPLLCYYPIYRTNANIYWVNWSIIEREQGCTHVDLYQLDDPLPFIIIHQSLHDIGEYDSVKIGWCLHGYSFLPFLTDHSKYSLLLCLQFNFVANKEH